MNQHRKIITLVCTFLMTLHIAACGQTTGVEFTAIQQKSDIQTLENTDLEINGDETVNTTESSVNQPESDVPTVENTALEAKEDETINAADTRRKKHILTESHNPAGKQRPDSRKC